MKILILSFYYEPDLCAGSFRTTAFVRELKTLLGPSADIDVVTTMPNRYHSYEKTAAANELSEGVSITRIALPSHKSGMVDQAKAFSKFAFGALRHLHGKQYDIVFATSSRLFTAVLGAFVAGRAKARLYLDLRDIFTDTLDDVLTNPLLRPLIRVFKVMEKWAVRSADRVNLVSRGFEDYFKSIAPSHEYRYFTNGIDDEFLDFKPAALNDESRRKTILYAGNIGEGQGLEKIIPGGAKALADQYDFLIVGDGGARAKLEAALEEQQVTNVRLLKPVDRTKLLDLYAQSDYLLMHLNDYKAFEKVLPSKIFEYAATGKPVLAGVAGYAGRFVQQEVPGAVVFKPCDVSDFVEKLKTLPCQLIERGAFIDKFKRQNIMREMAADLLACGA